MDKQNILKHIERWLDIRQKNGYKNARIGFKGMEDGVLIVSASVENGMLHTCVKNNGHILDTHFSTKSFDLGLQIVRILVEIELNGSFILKNKGDMAEAHIRIPLSIMENKR